MPDRDLDGSLANSDLRIFKSGYLADATVVCNGREWKVHRLILATRSKWFRKALCGDMLESKTRKVILDEEDPDLIYLLLRFIYAKDLDLTELNDGEGVPELCVKLFRVADFFLVSELKELAMTELKTHLDNMPIFFNTDSGDDQSPKWIDEVLQALEEAYKDSSTEPILNTVLEFVYPNLQKVFRFKNGVALLHRIPQMAVHLLENHITVEVGKQAQTTGARFGLPVLAAVESSCKLYQAKPADDGSAKSVVLPCLLYPDVKGPSSVFTVVDPRTNREADGLGWMAPSACEVTQITSHPDCDIVRVEGETLLRGKKWMYLHFDNCDDATIYVERFCKADRNIKSLSWTPDALARKMRRLIERYQ